MRCVILTSELPRASPVWKYFVKTTLGGKCKVCQKEIKGSGNTTNLKLHLERIHPNVELSSNVNNKADVLTTKRKAMHTLEIDDLNQDPDDPDYPFHISPSHTSSSSTLSTVTSTTTSVVEEPTKRKQPRIDTTLVKQSSFQDGGSKAAEITNKILFMLAKDNMPYQTVEKEGKTITKLMEEKYDVLSTMIKNNLSKVENLSLTTDIWTDPLNTRSYLGVTSHYIVNSKHKSVTIGVTELTERHTSDYIESWFLDIINDWKIKSDSIVVVVSDSGANIKKAIKDAFGSEKHLSCIAHTLNLIPAKVIELSPDINLICKKIKSIVTHFKKSVIAADKLRASSNLKLIQSIDTRWNSTHDMCQRFVELSDIIGGILLQCTTAPLMVTALELQTTKEFINLLKPFVDATKIVSGEPYLTASKVIPVINTLRVALNISQPQTEIGIEMKELLVQQFQQRFETIEDESNLAISTILDPRFKNIHFKDELACSNAIKNISKTLNKRILNKQPLQINSSNITVKNDFWSYHKDLVNKIKSQEIVNSNDNETPDDLRFYLIQPPIEMTSCPIQFWKSSSDTALGKLAMKYISIIATSVPCERIFSMAGRIITESRNRLNAEHLQQLLFLGLETDAYMPIIVTEFKDYLLLPQPSLKGILCYQDLDIYNTERKQ
ncbi:E3 SUMO-protein ligase ZBED1-like [Prorops nasuta]|uniref:E3 SUMO-protein ligase ZBED1-like n=1 Tax=Prorops nasuta TaxID=863751 RepID=UPI0034CD5810